MAHRGRCSQLLRTWEVLVLLRGRQRSLSELARLTNVTTRTMRRDLDALCHAGFPLVCSRDSLDLGAGGPEAIWSLASMPEWPVREVAPIAMPDLKRVNGHGHRIRVTGVFSEPRL